MLSRALSFLTVIATALALLILTWPQVFGLQNAWVVAHGVSLRGIAVLVSVALVVVLLVLARVTGSRRVLGALAVLLALFGVANAGILAARGFGTGDADAGGGRADSVTVVSWNTLGDAPGADTIAKLALDKSADIVTLPETTEATGEAVAVAMREGGRPMWVHTIHFDEVSKARSTTLLISPDLGDYEVRSELSSGPPGNTNVLPTVVATPVRGAGPTVIAVHAVAPIQFEMSNWRSDLDWLASQCDGDNVIMAGDFNATIDHMAGRGGGDVGVLGKCTDAGLEAGAGAVGTWPTSLPPLLGSPIDHVLSTPNWKVDSMSVVESEDSTGSDHRPIVAELSTTR